MPKLRKFRLVPVVLVAVLAAAAPAASAKVQVYPGGLAHGINDNGDLAGSNAVQHQEAPSTFEIVRWTASGTRTAFDPARSAGGRDVLGGGDINNDGTVSVVVYDRFSQRSELLFWDGSSAKAVYSPDGPFSFSAYLGLGADWRVYTGSGEGRYWLVNGSALDPSVHLIPGGNGSYVSFVGENGSGSMTYLDPYAGITAPLPGGQQVQAVAPRGTVLVGPDAGPLKLLRWDPVAAKFVPTELPALPVAGPMGYVINSAGRVIASKFGTVGTDAAAYSLRPGGAWEDVLTQLAPSGAHSFGVADVNEWGDVLARYGEGSGYASHDSSSVLTSRVALTGQVAATGAANGRAARQVALSGGPAPVTAPVDAKGRFSIPVPPLFAGLSLSAPAGSCLVVASGCATSVTLPPLSEAKATVVLAKTTTPAVASFAGKKLSAIKVRSGAASTSVKCAAAAPAACVVTVTMRKGRVVVGTGKVTVAKGRAKLVVVKLTKAWAALVAATPSTEVAASLTAKVGRSSVTLVQAFKLLR